MTSVEALRNERDEITARLGYYIPPYRVSELMKIAQKITEIMMRSVSYINYRECRFVLSVVGGAIDAAAGKENEHDPAEDTLETDRF